MKTAEADTRKGGISRSPRNGAANPPQVSPAALIQMLKYQICNKCEIPQENKISAVRRPAVEVQALQKIRPGHVWNWGATS